MSKTLLGLSSVFVSVPAVKKAFEFEDWSVKVLSSLKPNH